MAQDNCKFDAVSKEEAENLVRSFREFIERHRGDIEALRILCDRSSKKRIGEECLKELELRLKIDFGPDPTGRLWRACEQLQAVAPDKVEAASCRFPAERGRLEAVPPNSEKRQDAASTFFEAFERAEPIANLSGNLPHFRQSGVTYFVTFRTADSLPREKLQQWEIERTEWLRAHPEPHTEADRRDYCERFPNRFHHWLDQGHGACVLRRPELKQIVEKALRFFDVDRYHLGEFVVMPNHIHALVTPCNENELSTILHSWKSYTAKQINKRLGLTGAF